MSSTCLEEAAHGCPTLGWKHVRVGQKVAGHYCEDISESKEHGQIVEEEVELFP